MVESRSKWAGWMGHDSVTIAADYPYYQRNCDDRRILKGGGESFILIMVWGISKEYVLCRRCYTLQLQNTYGYSGFDMSQSELLNSRVQCTTLALLNIVISRSKSSGVFGMQDWCTPRALSSLVRLDSRCFRIGSFPISHAHLVLHSISRRRTRKKLKKGSTPCAQCKVIGEAALI